jgi:hypothetical protein
MGAAGEALLDERHQVRVARIAEIVRESTLLDRAPNVRRLDVLDRAYRSLGGRYAVFADLLAGQREQLLTAAAQDIEDFATLIEAWAPLVRASKAVGADPAWR